MSKVTIGQILAETEAFMKQGSAEFRKKAGYAPSETVGGDGSGMPGSENDKPVDAKAKQPQSEVTDGLPSSGDNTEGAGTGETVEGASALDVTQPVAAPAKVPMVSADANADAKTGAAKVANDLLAQIRTYQAKDAAAAKSAAAPAAPVAAAAPAKKAEAAPVGELEITQDVLAKIASIILATEDGVQFAEAAMTKAAGAEAAQETFDFLQKQAAYNQGAVDAENMLAAIAANQASMEKAAQADYAQGSADAASIVGQMAKRAMAPKKAGAGISRAMLIKLGQDMADESIGDAEGAMGGMGSASPDEEISPEELEQALTELVDEGSITPEAAQQIIAAISGGAGAAEGTGAVGPEGMPPEGAMPPEAAAPSPEEEAAAKEAMAKRAAAIVKAINDNKAKQGK